MTLPTQHDSHSARTADGESTRSFLAGEAAATGPLAQAEAQALYELASSWKQGSGLRAEECFALHPELITRGEVAVRIIYEEVCLREEHGQRVEEAELFQRFPQWRDALAVLLDCHRLIEPDALDTVYPVAGQQLGDLKLLRELGRGGAGRVFLATQPALSDRPVVVKFTPAGGDEHLSLARVQHTNIVPLYLVQDFPSENLRAMCMPYLGGTSWSRLLEALAAHGASERSGRQIVERLQAAQPADLPTTPTGPALGFLQRANYVQAVCWIGACLADALHYAHWRGLVHLDIKPSNVLLAGDGQPMLLDFHLAREMVPPGAKLDRIGGTRGYMSPEQELASAAVRRGQPLSRGLDGRSDIYSLGVLLYESLCGRLPSADESESRRRLRQLNPLVGRGLEDLLHKCLATEPEARYATAADVAADLRRHLADLPLLGVSNRSLRERWQKWRRRKPHAFAVVLTATLAAALVGVVGLLFHGERLREARLALEQGRRQLADRDYTPAIERLQGGLDSLRWVPGEFDLKQSLRQQLSLARQARLADTLHTLVERLRFVDSFASVPVDKLRDLDAGCRTVWQARRQIVDAESTSAGGAEVRRRLIADLADLALLWADLRVRLAEGSQGLADAHRAALVTIDQAETLCGASGVLELARRQHTSALEGDSTADVPGGFTPRTAWEHFALGRWLLRADRPEEAQAEFDLAVEEDPGAFWPNFYRAISAYRLERFDEALNAASVCVALSPTSAECFYNRGLAHQALAHDDAALDDFGRAIALDPKLPMAEIGMARIKAKQGRYAEALSDLSAALAHGADAAEAYYEMALVHAVSKDRSAALRDLEKALSENADYAPARWLKRKLESQP